MISSANKDMCFIGMIFGGNLMDCANGYSGKINNTDVTESP